VHEPRKYDMVNLHGDCGQHLLTLRVAEEASAYAFTFGGEPWKNKKRYERVEWESAWLILTQRRKDAKIQKRKKRKKKKKIGKIDLTVYPSKTCIKVF